MKNRSTPLIFCCVLMLMLSGFSFFSRSKTALHKPAVKKSAYYKVVIDKSNYELKVYDEEGWLFTYPVVFGTSEKTDKMMEGDRRTPEGHFRIIAKKIHPEWGYFLLLDYPSFENLERASQLVLIKSQLVELLL